MTEWYVKDLSKLIGISVQTLHHYDRIGLLKPSLRLPNGYRKYSQANLLKLQRIIALKFFGFSLTQIKALITGKVDALENFAVQAKLLEQKANHLLNASKTLNSILSNVADNKSITSETIIKLIEVYHMTEKLEYSWVKEILTPDELREYAAFETRLKSHSTLEEKAAFEKNWERLVAEIKNNLDKNPASAIGIALGKKCMKITNELYGKKYAHLRTKIFEKGFGEGKGLETVGLTPQIVSWLDKAIDAYWRDRLYDILNKVGNVPSHIVLNLWNEALDDMYGENEERKKAIYDIALLADANVSEEAKEWLKRLNN